MYCYLLEVSYISLLINLKVVLRITDEKQSRYCDLNTYETFQTSVSAEFSGVSYVSYAAGPR